MEPFLLYLEAGHFASHTGNYKILISHCEFLIMFSCSLIERVRRTVRGSADDIGWLQRALDLPPVEDGNERFVEILDDIR